MKKIMLFTFFLLVSSSSIPAYSDSERIVGSIAGLAATVSLDYYCNKTTYPSWEGWKWIWNTLSFNDHDNWFGPTITLGWETIPELGGENKLYFVSRFFTYYATYAAAIASWRHCKKYTCRVSEKITQPAPITIECVSSEKTAE